MVRWSPQERWIIEENSGQMSPVVCTPFVHDLVNADNAGKGGLRGAVFEPY